MKKKARVLVCDDERSLRDMLGILLRRQGYVVDLVSGVAEARATIEREHAFDAVVTDLVMPDGSGLDVLGAAIAKDRGTQVIVITAYTTTSAAVEAMRQGAYDFIEKPFSNDVLLATLEKALEKRAIVAEVAALRGSESGLIGISQSMRRLRELIQRSASAPTSVLITGESGTGKELVARALHRESSRADQAFVVVNCGALPESLMESELFGHAKGAFTGASDAKEGLVRAADGGTLFLDEVGELPPSLQVKLLRVLQEKRVRPVGSEHEVAVDVRVVAATNRNLEEDIAAGQFREDLYYRLNVIRLEIPPLRERPEDVRPLAEHLLDKHCRLQRRQLEWDESALVWLSAQTFAGNVRELENLVERAVALSAGPVLRPEDFEERSAAATVPTPDLVAGFDLDAHLQDIERRILLQALEQSGGVRKKAAKLLGMTFRSFRYRLAKYDLDE